MPPNMYAPSGQRLGAIAGLGHMNADHLRVGLFPCNEVERFTLAKMGLGVPLHWRTRHLGTVRLTAKSILDDRSFKNKWFDSIPRNEPMLMTR